MHVVVKLWRESYQPKRLAARVTVEKKTLHFTMPALSVGVVTVKLQ